MATAGHGKKFRTGFRPGWLWRSFCKTQYASNPTLGDTENFLRCRLSVVRLLDHAKELGVLFSVSDEGGYWKDRDVTAMVEEVGQWNKMVAGLVGGMKDLLGGQGVEAHITDFPDSEHLEAAGRAGEAADDEGGGTDVE